MFRVSVLVRFATVAAIAACTAMDVVIASANVYPPYPDVWELNVPLSNKMKSFPKIRSARLEGGDVMIGYAARNEAENFGNIAAIPSTDLLWTTFFSRQSATIANGSAPRIVMNDGSVAKPKKVTRGQDNYPGTAEFKDGSYVVSSRGISHDCYIGPAKHTLNRYKSKSIQPGNSRRAPLQTKVVFLLLDEPIIWTGAEYEDCGESDRKLSVRVVSLQGDVIPLDDGGFLLIDEHVGWVIRFNVDLSTRTKLLNRRLFVFDLDPSKSPLFIDSITGKNYLDAKGNVQMQQALDDLYSYLLRIKKGDE